MSAAPVHPVYLDESMLAAFAASLSIDAPTFAGVRARLSDDGAVTTIDDAASLADVAPGDLVELSGEIVGNPLAQLLSLLAQVTPPGTETTGDEEEGLRLLLSMSADLAAAPVRDVLLLADDGVTGVLTLAAAAIADGALDTLLFGNFRVLGKVTRVLGEGEHVNLTRRTSLGLMGPEMARGMVRELAAHMEGGFTIEVIDPVVEPPAVQVLPLAVFA